MVQAAQNLSHAVMAQRHERADSLDDFPTPPWATRALLEHVIGPENVASLRCLEPACGRGHMAATLSEFFDEVVASDIFPYGFGAVADYAEHSFERSDWVITNPPFRLAEQFILKALDGARVGVAMLARTVFIESIGRYERLFSAHPPTAVAQFVERVPMVKGRLDRKASTATGYAWIVWSKAGLRAANSTTQMVWIPPCRRELERSCDYSDSFTGQHAGNGQSGPEPTSAFLI